MLAQYCPRLMAADGSLKAPCPVQRGMAIAEALRRSESSCLSRSVITMSRMGQFGNGLSSRGHLVALVASCEEAGERRASSRALHPGVQVVDGSERYHQQ